ncbi:MAG: type II secretion system F family protein [Acidobacteriia bacterium]|nr:type II secretion system F family protein [Terriglobia bacterium]
MATVLLLAFFLLLTSGITYFGYRVYSRPGRVQERLADVGTINVLGEPKPEGEGELLVRVIHHLGAAVPVSPSEVSESRRYLIAGGFRTDRAVSVFYGIKVISCVVLLVGAFFLHLFTGNPMLRVLVLAFAAYIGWQFPRMVLEHMIKRRQERLRLSLPDALDLMVVCVEAGLGLDQAFVSVTRELQETHREISAEFGLVNLEMRAGKRRADALHNLAERTGEDEVHKLVAILIQADRFGTSISESLRTHADFLRIRRRQQAEERAGKVGVKLVFPIFFCILPAMLIVTAGPGILQIVKYLFPMMKQFSV